MPILTSIIAAEDGDAEAIGESPSPLDEWSGIEVQDVDIPKIVTLHCVLTGELFDDVAGHYGALYSSESEGTLVLQMPDEVKERLAELDEDALEEITAELAATEEFEYAGWEADAVGDMLAALADLARLAESQGQILFVRIQAPPV